MFTLSLAQDKVKPHQTVALHFLIGLALFAFGILSYVFYFYTIIATEHESSMPEFKKWGIAMIIPGLVILLFSLFRGKWLKVPKNNRLFRIIEFCCALAYAAYFTIGHWWLPAGIFGILAATLLLATLWESSRNKTQYIHIDDKGVQLPASSRRNSLEWNEISRVILRFGILTIDCYDDHLYQWDVDTPDFDKEEMEAYCAKLVAENEHKKSNW
jgi:hypothetical protein